MPWHRYPPWSFTGLPWDLTAADFTDAATALATDRRHGLAEPLRPRLPATELDDTTEPGNTARIEALHAHHPPRRVVQGRAVYPVLLAPEGSVEHEGRTVAVLAQTGCIGSLRTPEATNHRRMIEHALEHGYYYSLEVAVHCTPEGCSAHTLDNAPASPSG